MAELKTLIRKWLNGEYYIETIALASLVMGISFIFVLIIKMVSKL